MSNSVDNQSLNIAARAIALIEKPMFKIGFVDGYNSGDYREIPDTELSTLYACGRLCGCETKNMFPSMDVTKITTNRTMFIAAVAEALCREVIPTQVGVNQMKGNNDERYY